MSEQQLYGGIEAGGTKFVCVVGNGPENIVERTRIDTTVPEETLGKVIRFFQPYTTPGKITAIGIGCFGPSGFKSRFANLRIYRVHAQAALEQHRCAWNHSARVEKLRRQLIQTSMPRRSENSAGVRV